MKFVCSIEFNIWTIVWRKLKWRHNDVITYSIFMKFKQKFIKSIFKQCIGHKTAEIQRREVNRELWGKKWMLSHCGLDLWRKVTNFNRVWPSAVSNHLAKTASKSVPPFAWNFVHWQTDRLTHTHRKTQTNCNENITPPRLQSWRGYIFIAVCLCLSVCVCQSVCLSVNKIPGERRHRFWRGFR